MNIKFIKYKSSFILLGLLFCFYGGYAQTRKIIGRIVDDESQKGIRDVNIIISGTTHGTFTNALGYFELTVEPAKDRILVISNVGYSTSQIELPKEDRFKFGLKKDYISLGRIDLGDYPKKQIEIEPAKKNSAKKNREVTKSDKKGDEEFIVVESNASFPGGYERFVDGLGEALATAATAPTKKDFFLIFTVSDSGKISTFHFSDSSASLIESARNYFQQMPNWTPGVQRGRSVPQYYMLSIGKIFSSPGTGSLFKFLSEKVKYPLAARRTGIEGLVLIQFEIDSSGKILTTRLIQDLGGDCGTEVINTLRAAPLETLSQLANPTHSEKFVLPVTFGFERPWPASFIMNWDDSYLLGQLNIIAMGIGTPRRK